MAIVILIGFIILIAVLFSIDHGYYFRAKSPHIEKPKPPKELPRTEWERKRDCGGVHPWVVDGRIDPKYIESLPDYDESATIETIEEKPY